MDWRKLLGYTEKKLPSLAEQKAAREAEILGREALPPPTASKLGDEALDAEFRSIPEDVVSNSSIDPSFLSKYKGTLGLLGAGGVGAYALTSNNKSADPSLLSERVNASQPSSQLPIAQQEQPPSPVQSTPPISKLDKQLNDSITQQLIASLKPERSKPTELDFGTESVGSQDKLRAAQEAEATSVLGNQLGKAAELIGSSISGTKPIAQSAFDQNIAMAGQGKKNYLEQIDQEKNDPNSPISKGLRQFAEKYGIKVKGDFTASNAEKILPYIFKSYEMEEARKAKKENTALLLQAKKEAADIKAGAKEEKPTPGQAALDKDFAKTYNDWNTNGKGLFEKNLARLENAKDELKKSYLTTGRVIGRLPDLIRPEKSIQIRDDVQAAAMASLRATLGPQFTEDEGKRIMAMAYNEKLSPAENIKKIDAAIKELKDNAINMESRSQHFEQNGTLKGWKSPKVTQKQESIPTSKSSNKIKVSNGIETLLIDADKHPEDLKHAISDGYHEVQ